jgi:creatinine amidohydrolase
MIRMPHRRWDELTTQDFAALDASRVVVAMTVAAVEQHGPHLPLLVDAAIARGIVDRAIEFAPADLPVLALPALPIGWSIEHVSFPGTLTLSADTTLALWRDVALSVRRAGFRRLAIVNAHGGQPQLADIVARELRVDHAMLVHVCNSWELGLPDGLFPPEEIRHGIHGGAIETSVLMHLRPDLVRREKLAAFTTRGQRENGPRVTGAFRFAWMTEDLNRAGACGDARLADADKGRAIVEHQARALVERLRQIAAFDLATLG